MTTGRVSVDGYGSGKQRGFLEGDPIQMEVAHKGLNNGPPSQVPGDVLDMEPHNSNSGTFLSCRT